MSFFSLLGTLTNYFMVICPDPFKVLFKNILRMNIILDTQIFFFNQICNVAIISSTVIFFFGCPNFYRYINIDILAEKPGAEWGKQVNSDHDKI